MLKNVVATSKVSYRLIIFFTSQTDSPKYPACTVRTWKENSPSIILPKVALIPSLKAFESLTIDGARLLTNNSPSYNTSLPASIV